MRERENYQSFRQKIDMYLDNALSVDDEKDFVAQIKHDPACSRLYASEKQFRDMIKNNIRRPNVSPNLIDSIKERIKVE